MSVKPRGQQCSIADIFSAKSERDDLVRKQNELIKLRKAKHRVIDDIAKRVDKGRANLRKLRSAHAVLDSSNALAGDIGQQCESMEAVVAADEANALLVGAELAQIDNAFDSLKEEVNAVSYDNAFLTWFANYNSELSHRGERKACIGYVYETMDDFIMDATEVSALVENGVVSRMELAGRLSFAVSGRYVKVLPREIEWCIPDCIKGDGSYIREPSDSFNLKIKARDVAIESILAVYIKDENRVLIAANEFNWAERVPCAQYDRPSRSADSMGECVTPPQTVAVRDYVGDSIKYFRRFECTHKLRRSYDLISAAVDDYFNKISGCTIDDSALAKLAMERLVPMTTPAPFLRKSSIREGSDSVYAKIRKEWDLLILSPWSDEYKMQMAKLKYLIEDGARPRFFNGAYEGFYGFRLRTRDHTWITGWLSIGHFKSGANVVVHSNAVVYGHNCLLYVTEQIDEYLKNGR